ncbi:PapG chaperone-binding domain-containing protein [Escherichia coli]
MLSATTEKTYGYNFKPLSKSSLEGQVSPPRKLSINCNTPTDVYIELVPVNPLPVISKGATVCGEGLACIVEFDGQQDSIKYHSLMSKSIAITSKLRVLDLLKVREGKFEGNAIMRISYN